MENVSCVLWCLRIRKFGPSRQFQILTRKVTFIRKKGERMFERFEIYHVIASWMNLVNVMLRIYTVLFHLYEVQ